MNPTERKPSAWIERRLTLKDSECVFESVNFEKIPDSQAENIRRYYQLEQIPLYTYPLTKDEIRQALEALRVGEAYVRLYAVTEQKIDLSLIAAVKMDEIESAIKILKEHLK